LITEETPDPPESWTGFIAVIIAIAGAIAGYAAFNFRFEASPTAPDYFDAVKRAQSLHFAVGAVAVAAPIAAILLGLRGRSWAGAVAGVLAAVFTMVWAPSLLRACCGGDESTMIGRMRAINSSQQAYSSGCAQCKFASSFETLATPPLTGGTGFMSPDLVAGMWHGYKVTMTVPDSELADTCNGKQKVSSGYFVEAHLVEPIEGRRSFATDDRGTVYENPDGTAIQPGMAGAQPIQ